MFEELEIPDFLRRVDTGERIEPPKPRRKRHSKKSATEKVHLHLNNELPKVGSGHRYVTVEKIGRKWITIGYGDSRHRVSKRLWESLKRIA
jgi:hypothetical protein